MNNVMWTLHATFCMSIFSCFLDRYPGVKLLAWMENFYLTFWNCKIILHFHQQYISVEFPHILVETCYFLFDYNHSCGSEVISHFGTNLYFTNYIECPFMCLLVIHVSFVKYTFRYFAHFIIGLFVLLNCKSYLYIFFQIYDCQMF